MRVLVMGSGGMGGYFGGVLAQGGHEVVFVARGAHLAAMRERGLEVRSGGESTVLRPVSAVTTPAEAGSNDFDLVLFTVKTYDTESAAQALRPAVGPNTAVLTLQNGVESVDQLSRILGAEHVLPGSARIETTILEPGVIDQRSPFRRIELGELSGEITPRLEAIAEALRSAGVEVTVRPDPLVAIWEKFVLLAPHAGATSACQATSGPIRETTEGAALLQSLIGETAAVGRACGVPLPPDQEERTWTFMQGLPHAFGTSMQRDYERQNRVELEQLTGTVVRRGREHGVPTPTSDAVYAILKVRALSFGGLS